MKPVYRTYEDFDYKDLLTYAGLDCIVTSSLLDKLGPQLLPKYILKTATNVNGTDVIKTEERESILEVTHKWEHKFHEFVIDMELNGIKYDVPGNAALKERMEDEIGELKASIFSCLGRTVDLDSGKDVGHLLFTELGLTTSRTTKTGQLSTDFEALIEMSEKYPDHPWLVDLAKYGDIVSTYRTFVQNYVQDHVKRDGRIHPQYNLHGTSSFRITGDSPNLTQLPNPKHGYNVRSLFIVDEGNAFLTADFSSAEIKILGAISKDPGILQSIKDGLDFHSFAAARINNIDYNEFVAVLDAGKTHPLYKKYRGFRQGAKAVGFGILKN